MTARGERLRFASHRQIADHAAARPPGYLRDFERIVVRRDEHGVWYDAGRPAYAELCAKYRGHLSSALGSAPSAAWQEWREHDGRWVPSGHVPPGTAADPPQFDPRPGEVLQTPAWPVEEFR